MKRLGTNELGPALVFVIVLTAIESLLAQPATPSLGPKPIFVPGLYETESRNSAFKDQGVKSKTCIASADFDAFKRETIAQYLKEPQFTKVCKLSDTKPAAHGFAFAMDCGQSKTIITFNFAKDLVSSTTQTLIVSRPEYSSTILTLSRRVGDCKGRPGDAL